jgi:hypothetical protein
MFCAVALLSAIAGALAWQYRGSNAFWDWHGWVAVGAAGTIVLALGTVALATSTVSLAAQTKRDVDAQFQPVIVGATRESIEPQVEVETTKYGLRVRLWLFNAGRGVGMSTMANIRSENEDAVMLHWGQTTGITIPAGGERVIEVDVSEQWAKSNLSNCRAWMMVDVRYADVAGNLYGTFLMATVRPGAGLRFKHESFRSVKHLRPMPGNE